jgi:hypothetical protein
MNGWHELWAHRPTGEVLAVHLVNGFVAGTCGPLSVTSTKGVDLTSLRYDTSLPAIYRVSTQPEEFVLAEPWLKGEQVPVRRPRGLLAREAIKARRSRSQLRANWRAGSWTGRS